MRKYLYTHYQYNKYYQCDPPARQSTITKPFFFVRTYLNKWEKENKGKTPLRKTFAKLSFERGTWRADATRRDAPGSPGSSRGSCVSRTYRGSVLLTGWGKKGNDSVCWLVRGGTETVGGANHFVKTRISTNLVTAG